MPPPASRRGHFLGLLELPAQHPAVAVTPTPAPVTTSFATVDAPTRAGRLPGQRAQALDGLLLTVAGLLAHLPARLAEQIPGLPARLLPDLTGLLDGRAGHPLSGLAGRPTDLGRLLPGHIFGGRIA